MNQRLVRKFIFALSFLCLWGAQANSPLVARNVVLFITDDQGQDAGCYGNSVIKTPNLDALAAEGTRFDYAFATTASCSASRSVILTGLFNHSNAHYGHQHGYNHFSSYDRVESLSVTLSRAGYVTARIGKYHVAPESVYKFDQVLKVETSGKDRGPIPRSARNPVAMAERSKAFFKSVGEKPFFLLFATSDPHRGGGLATEIPEAPDRFGNPKPGSRYPGVTEVTFQPDQVIVPPFLPNTPACRAELAQYYQSVWRVDQGLGRLVEALKETGKWDDTLFIFISDHGIAFPGAKTTVYEPGLRSPCIVRHPKAKKRGLVSRAMVSWVDLTPTILDYAGTQAQTPRQGRSFLSILKEANPVGWDQIFASHTFHEITNYYPMRVIRGRRYKLIWNIAHGLPYPFASDLWAAPTWKSVYKHGPDALYGKRTVKAYIHRAPFELYDLDKDPQEIHNLADDPTQAERLAELKGKLRAFQESTDDPWKVKWRYE